MDQNSPDTPAKMRRRIAALERQLAKAKAKPPKRARPYHDTPEVADGVCRQIAALGRRIAQEDPDDLRHLDAIASAAREAMEVAVHGERVLGHTDGLIGRALGGVTRQAVEQRWPR
jgi:hypothetical protein